MWHNLHICERFLLVWVVMAFMGKKAFLFFPIYKKIENKQTGLVQTIHVCHVSYSVKNRSWLILLTCLSSKCITSTSGFLANTTPLYCRCCIVINSSAKKCKKYCIWSNWEALVSYRYMGNHMNGSSSKHIQLWPLENVMPRQWRSNSCSELMFQFMCINKNR